MEFVHSHAEFEGDLVFGHADGFGAIDPSVSKIL